MSKSARRRVVMKLSIIPVRSTSDFPPMSLPLPLPLPPQIPSSIPSPIPSSIPSPIPSLILSSIPSTDSGCVVEPGEMDRILLLGHGSSGKVYKVAHRQTQQIYALKIIREKHEPSVCRQILREMQILRSANSPHVVRCYGVSDHAGEISFLLEYMDRGSLADSLAKHRSLPEHYLAEVGRQVLNGLAYLHRNKIVHRDIKPSNLLINSKQQVKIADFGVSTVLASTMAACSSFVGTCAYMSPERLDPDIHGGNYDGCAADIWSLGLTLLECATGHFPLLQPGQKPDWPTLMVSICFRDPPSPPPDASPEFRSFITQCLQKDSTRRPTASHLLSHPFLSKYPLKTL